MDIGDPEVTRVTFGFNKLGLKKLNLIDLRVNTIEKF